MTLCRDCKQEKSKKSFTASQLKTDRPVCKDCHKKPQENAPSKNPPEAATSELEISLEELQRELLEAARYGDRDALLELFSYPALDINVKDLGGSTALHRASANGHVDCVRLLIERGAAHLPNDSGNTPLHWAVQNKRLEVVQALLEGYPDIDVLARNSFGKGSLTEAFLTNEAEIIGLLLSHKSADEEKLKTDGGKVREDGEDADGEGDGDSSVQRPKGPSGSRVVQETTLEMRLKEGGKILRVRELGLDWTGEAFGADANDDTTGITVWSASLLLARWIVSLSPLFNGKRVLELGAGCGVPGLAAHLYTDASGVILTDLMDHTVENLAFNAKLNQEDEDLLNKESENMSLSHCHLCKSVQRFTPDNPEGKLMKCGRCRAVVYCSKDCQKRDWSNHKRECRAASLPPKRMLKVQKVNWFEKESWPDKNSGDIILGSDLIYTEGLVPALIAVVEHSLSEGGSVLYVASQERQGLSLFKQEMQERGFDCEVMLAPESYKENPLVNCSPSLFELHFNEMAEEYCLFHFRKKQGSHV